MPADDHGFGPEALAALAAAFHKLSGGCGCEDEDGRAHVEPAGAVGPLSARETQALLGSERPIPVGPPPLDPVGLAALGAAMQGRPRVAPAACTDEHFIAYAEVALEVLAHGFAKPADPCARCGRPPAGLCGENGENGMHDVQQPLCRAVRRGGGVCILHRGHPPGGHVAEWRDADGTVGRATF